MDSVSAAICFSAKSLSFSPYDHVGLVVLHPDSGEPFFLEANAGGVTLRPLYERLKRSKASQLAVRRLTSSASVLHQQQHPGENFEEKQRRRLWQVANEYVGTSYMPKKNKKREKEDNISQLKKEKKSKLILNSPPHIISPLFIS